jgi:hypothetical protein
MNKQGISRYGIMAMGILLTLTGHFSSCEPEDWLGNVDCNECFGYKPDSAKLIVYLTINGENDSVPLTIFEGETDGRVDWQDTATSGEFYLDAAVGVTYTVRAEYRSGSRTIVAFDSDRMTLKDYGEECGDPCYIIKGGIFNVQLLE